MDKNEYASSPSDRRLDRRLKVDCEILLRREGRNNYRVRLFDLSTTGCKVELVERPRLLERMWVKFDRLEPLHAVVSWIQPPVAGLRFERPIHPAVFELLVKNLPPKSS